ncbi:hypothetical protein Fmac_032511 [Flemingia macrophylla]|uniref:Uncharacterized protein n=1 Tax=Flemingia macrophylla TaxID=520843 RepID=A0ABD1L6H4_9FABA
MSTRSFSTRLYDYSSMPAVFNGSLPVQSVERRDSLVRVSPSKANWFRETHGFHSLTWRLSTMSAGQCSDLAHSIRRCKGGSSGARRFSTLACVPVHAWT